ncbi:MAG: nickel pincer cofactor biosynthesis protein LarB [Pseudomonadota bacterium]
MIVRFDHGRRARTGVAEAVLCEGKHPHDIAHILATTEGPLLLTRIDAPPPAHRDSLDHDPLSRTAIRGPTPAPAGPPVAIVCAGTADRAVAAEAARTLAFHGVAHTLTVDVGVAGLWRLMEAVETLEAAPVIIAVAGMEGALFSVLGGLVAAPLIAVPTSVGYGVSAGGNVALSAALASCAPGVTVVNIDNGFGAAAAAIRILNAARLRVGAEIGTSEG